MARELVDRRDRLFGRENDLASLLDRARFKGLTAVVARPQMGKSWLLNELARRFAEQHQPRHLVGFAESAGQTPDLLLRAVVDLYSRWLADAAYRQQAQMVWEHQKLNLLPGVVKAVGSMINEAGQIAKPITGIVEDAINGLIATNQTLTTGGIQLPTLQYDQARDLVDLTHRISSSPIALFLDQWEQSPDPKFEAKTIHAFLHHLDQWPPCHLFLALRPDASAFGEVQSLGRSLPGTAAIYRLGEMDLDADGSERMLAHVRAIVPAARDQSDATLRELVAGFPGVLYRWTSDYQREHMATLSNLESVAQDAHEYRFGELSQLLLDLQENQRRMAIRLALLPPFGEDVWSSVKGEVLGNLREGLIDDLALARVFESRDPPGFGHAKRWESARIWLFKERRADVRSETERPIARLAAPVRGLDIRVFPHTVALGSLLPATREVGADTVWTATCMAAATLLGDRSAVNEILIQGTREARVATFGAMASLLAMGLFNTLIDAKAEDDPGRRDALL